MRFFLLILTLLSSFPVFDSQAQDRYRKKDIINGRYGDAERREWIKKAHELKKSLEKKVFGQARAVTTLQESLIQYYESFGSRTREPVSMNFIGFPGTGKSVLADELERLGFNVAYFDMQKYPSSSSFTIIDDFRSAWNMRQGKPWILLLDELDKIPEISGGNTIESHLGEEKTHPAIGSLNSILTDGKLGSYGGRLDFSNVLVITTMNFSPNEIEYFTKSVLKAPKSFYELTVEDFEKFDKWLLDTPSSRYQVLSRLFRTNTVSRLAPNTVIFKPLNHEDYQDIAKKIVNETIDRLVTRSNGTSKIQVSSSDRFISYLAELTTVPSSGARETVFRVDRLTEQLVGYAMKYRGEEAVSLAQPRKIFLDFDLSLQKVVVKITPQVLYKKEILDKASFEFKVAYDPVLRLFKRPENIQILAPKFFEREFSLNEEPVATKKALFEIRFPKDAKPAYQLAEKLDKKIIGQEITTKMIESEMNQYLARPSSAVKQPSFSVLAGFPGIGKSELTSETAKLLNIPIVRIGMQQFSSDENSAVTSFIQTLSQKS